LIAFPLQTVKSNLHKLHIEACTWASFSGATSASASGSAVSQALGPKMSPLIREFVQAVDDREWQSSLFSLLQNQTYNQCEVDLFELMCKVLDQNLFSQVDWARNSIFFKDLKVSFCWLHFKFPLESHYALRRAAVFRFFSVR
jgi:hypothetical protein